jgi:hypothetical protein
LASPLYKPVIELTPSPGILGVTQIACPLFTLAVFAQVISPYVPPGPLRENITDPVASDGETVAVKVKGCPVVYGFGEKVRVIVGTSFVTVSVRLAEVTLLLLASPLYVALTKCVFADRLERESVALPLFSPTVPRETGLMVHGAGAQVSSENVTVPLAVDGVTVAVKLTFCLNDEGLGLAVRVIVAAGGGAVLTVSVNGSVEDGAYLSSPLYVPTTT